MPLNKARRRLRRRWGARGEDGVLQPEDCRCSRQPLPPWQCRNCMTRENSYLMKKMCLVHPIFRTTIITGIRLQKPASSAPGDFRKHTPHFTPVIYPKQLTPGIIRGYSEETPRILQGLASYLHKGTPAAPLLTNPVPILPTPVTAAIPPADNSVIK